MIDICIMTLSPDPMLTVRYLFSEYAEYCVRNGLVRDHTGYIADLSALIQRDRLGSSLLGVNLDDRVNLALVFNMILDDEPVRILEQTVRTASENQGTLTDLYAVLKTIDVLKSNESDSSAGTVEVSSSAILEQYNRDVADVREQLGCEPPYEMTRIVALPRTVEAFSFLPGYDHARRYLEAVDGPSKIADSSLRS